MIEAILAGLAGYRIASLLVEEEGPFDVFLRLRRRAGIREGEPIIETPFTGVLSCMWCATIWTAGVCYAVAEWVAVEPIALIAAAGVAALAHVYAEGQGRDGTS